MSADAEPDMFAAPAPEPVEVPEAGEGVYDCGSVEQYAEDSITPLVIGGSEIILIKQEGEFYAMPDQCTHQRYPLSDGEMLPGKIRCVHHGATFDLRTGRPTLPAVKKIQLFTAFQREGRVMVSLQVR